MNNALFNTLTEHTLSLKEKGSVSRIAVFNLFIYTMNGPI